MVTINTAADLLRALAENPRWKEAVRREILAEQRQLNASPSDLISEQRQFQRRAGGIQCAD